MSKPTNKDAEIIARKSGATGCIITVFFNDHSHVAMWHSNAIGKMKRETAISMIDDVLAGADEIYRKIGNDDESKGTR